MGYHLRMKRRTKVRFRRFPALRRKIPSTPKRTLRERIVRGGYCLYCFHAPLDASHRCDECDRVSLPSLRVEYWNQHPRFLKVEKAGKLFAAFGVPAIALAAMILGSMHGSPGGWGRAFCFAPVLVGVAMWKTVGKLTRNDPYFRPSYLWGFTALGLSFICSAVDWRWSAGFAVLAALVIWSSVAAHRWKLRLIGVLDTKV